MRKHMTRNSIKKIILQLQLHQVVVIVNQDLEMIVLILVQWQRCGEQDITMLVIIVTLMQQHRKVMLNKDGHIMIGRGNMIIQSH